MQLQGSQFQLFEILLKSVSPDKARIIFNLLEQFQRNFTCSSFKAKRMRTISSKILRYAYIVCSYEDI